MQNMIKQDREEHRAQLEDAVRRIFPFFGYTPEAIDAFMVLSREEGIIPAIESSHAIAKVMSIATDYPKEAGITDIPNLL